MFLMQTPKVCKMYTCQGRDRAPGVAADIVLYSRHTSNHLLAMCEYGASLMTLN